MITFLEGLPRSGKSYSACKDSIVPALQKGRKVYAYIAGLNHEKLAELAGIDIAQCRDLLVQVEAAQVLTIYDVVSPNSLVVLDEVQNFWPAQRQPLEPKMTRFITEHGHDGLDIIFMGQMISKVHSHLRGLVERKIYYLKKTALGKPNEYTASFYSVVPKGKDVGFELIQTIDYKYDDAYFGAYKSHTDGTTNKDTFIDDRAIVWNSPLFRKWLPIAGVVTIGAIGYLAWFMQGGLTDSVIKKQPQVAAKGVIVEGPQPTAAQLRAPPGQVPTVNGNAVAVPVAPALPPVMSSAPADIVEVLNKQGRIRFTGFVRIGDNIKGFVEWRDSAMNLLQTMTLLDLSGLGYVVMVNQTGTLATLTKGATQITAMAWPIDRAAGRVSETEQAKIAGHPKGMAANPG